MTCRSHCTDVDQLRLTVVGVLSHVMVLGIEHAQDSPAVHCMREVFCFIL